MLPIAFCSCSSVDSDNTTPITEVNPVVSPIPTPEPLRSNDTVDIVLQNDLYTLPCVIDDFTDNGWMLHNDSLLKDSNVLQLERDAFGMVISVYTEECFNTYTKGLVLGEPVPNDWTVPILDGKKLHWSE